MDVSEDSKLFCVRVTIKQKAEEGSREKGMTPDKLMICSILQGKSGSKGTCFG